MFLIHFPAPRPVTLTKCQRSSCTPTTATFTFTLNNQTFATKPEVKAHIQTVIRTYRLGDSLNAEDTALVTELLSQHPRWPAKIGPGLDRITVDKPPNGLQGRCFYIHRIDGSSTDISFKKCLDALRPSSNGVEPSEGSSAAAHNNTPDSPQQEKIPKALIEALRFAVFDQIKSFKEEEFAWGPVMCPYTNIELKWHNCSVQYGISLPRLVAGWLLREGLTPDQVPLMHEDNALSNFMVDHKQLGSWRDFHKRYAKMRLVAAPGKQKQLAQQQRQAEEEEAAGGTTLEEIA